MTTDAAPAAEAATPSTPETPLSTADQLRAINNTPPTEEPAPEEEAQPEPETPAPEGEGESEDEPESEGDDEDEEPKAERTVEELQAAFDRNEDLTNAEIRRLSEHIQEQQNDDALRQQYQQQVNTAVQNFQNAPQYILNALQGADLRTEQGRQLALYNLQQKVINPLMQQMSDAYAGPLMQDATRQLREALVATGMKPADADAKVKTTRFADFGKVIAETVKKSETSDVVKKSDINLAYLEKNFPKVMTEFHKKWPERGGRARPSGGGANAAGADLPRNADGTIDSARALAQIAGTPAPRGE